MAIGLISVGLFVWFVLAFNGSVGAPFVDSSFFMSALFMVVSGALTLAKVKPSVANALCALALLFYLPMIWQRFNFKFNTDWVGLGFDGLIVVFLLAFLIKNLRDRSSRDIEARSK